MKRQLPTRFHAHGYVVHECASTCAILALDKILTLFTLRSFIDVPCGGGRGGELDSLVGAIWVCAVLKFVLVLNRNRLWPFC